MCVVFVVQNMVETLKTGAPLKHLSAQLIQSVETREKGGDEKGGRSSFVVVARRRCGAGPSAGDGSADENKQRLTTFPQKTNAGDARRPSLLPFPASPCFSSSR